MRRVVIANLALILIAVFAFAQAAPAPPAPPAAPATPATPKAPRAPRSPRASQAYLGIDTCDANGKGVEVLMVDQDAPAGKAGLKEHDVITSFNGKQVTNADELKQMIRSTPPGKNVNIGFLRNGAPQTATAQLASRHSMETGMMIHIPKIEIPPMPDIEVPRFEMLQSSRRSGLVIESLNPQLGEFFGVEQGHGVLVRSVEPNSSADSAGFKAGDVIVRVGDEPIDSMADWNQSIRQQQAGKVNVTVVREKRKQTLTLSVPDRRRSQMTMPEMDTSDLNIQIADLGPEIQKQVELAQKAAEQAFRSQEFQKKMQDLQHQINESMRVNQKDVQKQMEKAREEVERAMHDLERQMREEQHNKQRDEE